MGCREEEEAASRKRLGWLVPWRMGRSWIVMAFQGAGSARAKAQRWEEQKGLAEWRRGICEKVTSCLEHWRRGCGWGVQGV